MGGLRGGILRVSSVTSEKWVVHGPQRQLIAAMPEHRPERARSSDESREARNCILI